MSPDPSHDARPPRFDCDVLVVGGSWAGLSAALVLARCRREVVVLDAGSPRNAAAREIHGFLSRDGADPRELLRAGRDQLAWYGGRLVAATVREVRPIEGGFEAIDDEGRTLRARHLVLATGMRDVLPPIDGLRERFGTSVFTCAYCDAWEQRDRRIGLLARADDCLPMARTLQRWSRDIVLFTDGAELSSADLEAAKRLEIRVEQRPIRRLEGDGGTLTRVVTKTGEAVARDALFVKWGSEPASQLPRELGCHITDKGIARTGEKGETGVDRLWMIGDAAGGTLAIEAAADGARAAIEIHEQLEKEAWRAEGPMRAAGVKSWERDV